MKKLLVLLSLLISLLAEAQTQYLGGPTTTVITPFVHTIGVGLQPPTDTLSSAPNGSIATKNGVLYVKNPSGVWVMPGFSDPLTTNGDIIARIAGVTTRFGQGLNGTFLGVSSGLLGYYVPSVIYQFNVKDYGATGDGVTNDLTSINNCFTAALAFPGQATIVFPQGNYKITGSIVNITRPVLIQGVNATITASGGTAYNAFDIKSDTVRLYGMKVIGSSTAQTGCNINGFKYFDLNSCEFTALAKGIRFANTSSAFNAGNINLCNFYANLIGIQSDTLGEYVTVSNCLLKSNTVAIQNDGGNNLYANDQVNSNTTAYKFTGGSNNSHGSIVGGNANHNGTSLDVNGANFGETIIGWHAYEGHILLVNSSNWMFEAGTILAPDSVQIWGCANIDFSKASIQSTYNPKYSFVGNLIRPKFADNFGDPGSSLTTPNGSVPVFVDSLGGHPTRSVLTGDTLDLGNTRWQTKTLTVDDTIKKIIHPTAGRIYRLEIIANGHNFVMYDNTKVSGSFNPNAAINIYYIECIDDGADPRFLVSVSQPGIMVSRPTAGIGWGRFTGAATASNNNLTKTGPDGTAFTVWAWPDKVLSAGDGYYVAQAASTNANIIWGLSTTAVQNSYNSINYAIYFFSTSGAANNVNVVESGTIISTGLGGTNWTTNDSFRVYVGVDDSVRYQKYSGATWNTFRTAPTKVPARPLIPQVAIRALTTFTNPRLYGSQVTNNLQSPFVANYPDNLNAPPPSILASGSVTNAATLDINMSAYYALYDVIEITLYDMVPLTGNTDLYLRVSADGTTYDNGAANYQHSYNFGSGGTGNTTDIAIKLGGAYGTGSSSNGTIKLFSPGRSAYNPKVVFHINETDNSANNVPINGAGARLAGQVTKAVRFLFSSGNITASYKVRGF